MGRDALAGDIAGVEHGDAHQALHDELRLEQVLALLVQALRATGLGVSVGQGSQTQAVPPLCHGQPCRALARPAHGVWTLELPRHPPTLTEILPSSLGRWAARNQSPGSGLVTLKTPVVRLGSVQVRVRAKEPGTAVSRGKWVWRGLMTGGAPERKYLQAESRER